MVDNLSDQLFCMAKGTRWFQIAAPDLSPIGFEIVEELTETDRGAGGFGSTG